MKLFFEKIKEAAISVLPLSAVFLLLHFTVAEMPLWYLYTFLAAIVLLILGMSVFMIGIENSVMPIGEMIGTQMTKSKKLWIILVMGFILGLSVTLAEPDLQVLAMQITSVNKTLFVTSVAVGVGIYLMMALLRIVFQFSMARIFQISYALIFILAIFVKPEFISIAFDSSGVTTGPVTVPFILTLGMGVSSIRGGKSAEEDSFGLCGLCSVGPILTVLILGLLYKGDFSDYVMEVPQINDINSFFSVLSGELISTVGEVAIILLPIVLIFLFFQVFKLRLSRINLSRILINVVFSLIGLSVFLTAVNVGFMPVGIYIGGKLASLPYNWILMPISIFIGMFVVLAEPAVHVLNKQIYEITSGAIPKKMMLMGLMASMSLALLFSVIRALYSVSIWWFVLPGFALAIILTFFTPKIFTAIAFDSGGVASGTMCAAFLLPFAVGISQSVGGNVMTDAFGLVGITAMMPLISVQLMGLIYKVKMDKLKKKELLLAEQDQPQDVQGKIAPASEEKQNLSGLQGDGAKQSADEEQTGLDLAVNGNEQAYSAQIEKGKQQVSQEQTVKPINAETAAENNLSRQVLNRKKTQKGKNDKGGPNITANKEQAAKNIPDKQKTTVNEVFLQNEGKEKEQLTASSNQAIIKEETITNQGETGQEKQEQAPALNQDGKAQ